MDTWVIFALVAQLAWAIGIFIDKHLVTTTNEKEDAPLHNAGTLVLVSASFGFVIAVITAAVTYAIQGTDASRILFEVDQMTALTGLASGVLEVAWLLPYFIALHHGDETTAPPVFQTIPIFGIVLGYVWFGEYVTVAQALAMLLIVGGALWLNLEFVREENSGQIRTAFKCRSVMLMLLSSFIIAVTSFLFKDVALEASFGAATFWMGIGATLGGVLIGIAVPSYRKEFITFLKIGALRTKLLNVVNEVIDAVAIVFFTYAVVQSPNTAVVQASHAIQPVLLLCIGWLLALLGSPRQAVQLRGWELVRRIAGVTIILIGSLLLFT